MRKKIPSFCNLPLVKNWHFWPHKGAYVIYEWSQSVSSTTPAPFHQPSYSPTVTNILENLGVSGKGVSLYKLHFVIVVIDKMWTKHQYLFQISWIPTKTIHDFQAETSLITYDLFWPKLISNFFHLQQRSCYDTKTKLGNQWVMTLVRV